MRHLRWIAILVTLDLLVSAVIMYAAPHKANQMLTCMGDMVK